MALFEYIQVLNLVCLIPTLRDFGDQPPENGANYNKCQYNRLKNLHTRVSGDQPSYGREDGTTSLCENKDKA